MIQEKMQMDQIHELKKGNSAKVAFLRYILSKIKNREIEKKTALTDEEVILIVQKVAGELGESIKAAKKVGRSSLLKEYQIQLDIVNTYLPAQLSDEDLRVKVKEIIQAENELFMKNPKALIGICSRLLRSQARPERIAKMIENLSN